MKAFAAISTSLALLLGAAFCETNALAGEIPERLPPSRYSFLRENPPFSVITEGGVLPPTKPNFAQDLYLLAIMQYQNRDYVRIASRDGQLRRLLITGETSPEGMTVVGVQWAPELGRTIAVIKQGDETAQVRFDGASGPLPAGSVTASKAQPVDDATIEKINAAKNEAFVKAGLQRAVPQHGR